MSTDNEFATIMHNITQRHREDQHREHADEITRMNNMFPDPIGPYEFHRYLYIRGEELTEKQSYVLAQIMSAQYAPGEDEYLLTDLYYHYRDYKRHISGLVSDIEGPACSVDKTIGIIDIVSRRLAGHSDPEPSWNLPEEHTWDQWFTLITSIPSFTLGFVQGYITALKELMGAYSEKEDHAPSTLSTIEDYENAPDGTIVAEHGQEPFSRQRDHWVSYNQIGATRQHSHQDMFSSGTKSVLRWGWGWEPGEKITIT